MPQVDFYILPDESAEQRLLFGCRLADKAFKLGHSLYLHCTDSQQAQQLDDYLWRFQPSSFLPHAQEPNAPLQIGWGPLDRDSTDNTVLINLSLIVPVFFDRLPRSWCRCPRCWRRPARPGAFTSSTSASWIVTICAKANNPSNRQTVATRIRSPLGNFSGNAALSANRC